MYVSNDDKDAETKLIWSHLHVEYDVHALELTVNNIRMEASRRSQRKLK